MLLGKNTLNYHNFHDNSLKIDDNRETTAKATKSIPLAGHNARKLQAER